MLLMSSFMLCVYSWHASCALAGNCLFIHGGYNGNVVLADSFIFDLGEILCITATVGTVIRKVKVPFP